jgi:hypothetical protein
MNASCRDQPVSFLRLERYLQGDVDARERERVVEHLRYCEVCRVCFEELQHDVVELLPIPESVRKLPQRRPVHGLARAIQLWPQLTAALAIAAVVALWARPHPERPVDLPAGRVAIKGGELALSLVREHAGTLFVDSEHFVEGDRMQVRVSCPPGQALRWDLVVFQGGTAYFPLTPSAPLQCGNGATLPGAFTLDGTAPADVCVVVAPDGTLDRARLREPGGVRALGAACVRVSPAGGS